MNTSTAVKPALGPRELVAALRARYAVKKFDPAGRLDPAEWDALLESLVLSPSSYGLQPWRFIVVEYPALRQSLREASWNQAQVTDADKLVVLAARVGIDATDVDRFIARVAEVRGVPVDSLAGYRGMMLAKVSGPTADVDAWAKRQVYIALGTLLASAAALGVDAVPMEGLDPARYDALLGLPAEGYATVCAVALGRRAVDDAYAAAPKVRFQRGDVVRTL